MSNRIVREQQNLEPDSSPLRYIECFDVARLADQNTVAQFLEVVSQMFDQISGNNPEDDNNRAGLREGV